MKVIINRCFGGFHVRSDIANSLGYGCYDATNLRFNAELIAMIESGVDCNGWHSELVVVNIPATATDYEIEDYDGYESIIAVVDGQIRHIY